MSSEIPLAQIEELAHELYDLRPRVSRFDSHNNRVYHLDFAGRLAPRVLKIAGPSETAPAHILAEQKALGVLASAGLPVPRVEKTQNDVPNAPRPFFTMLKLPGDRLETTWKTKPLWQEKAWRRAGMFAAQMRSVPLESVREVLRVPREEWDGTRAALSRHGFLRPPFSDIIDAAQEFHGVDEGCFIHGDYAANQIVTDGEAFAVVDWEGATLGSTLGALSRINAMTREYGGTLEHIEWTIAGFESVEPLNAARRSELHVREMMQHVGVMSWKLGWMPDHDAHARAMARRVESWWQPR